MQKKLFLSFILISVTNIMFSQVLRYSNDFLNIGISARNLSLGNSIVASVNDYSSGYYNSAGLSNLQNDYEFSIMHSEYYAGLTKYDFGGISYKLNDSMGVSLSVVRLGIDNIQNTLFLFDENGNINYDRIELFSVSDYAMMLAFGKKTRISGLNVGANAKIIFRNQGEFAKAYGFGLDIGLQYVKNKWHFGTNLLNATTTFSGWFYSLSPEVIAVFEQTDNEIPENAIELTMPILNSGVARYFSFSDKTGLQTELDLNFTFDGKRNALVSFNPISFYPQLGLEFNYKKILFVRSGVNNFQLIPNFSNNTETEDYFKEKSLDFVPSIGVGLVFYGFYLDYALTDVANQAISLYSHIFSLSYKF
ncbi:MAG: hypothetical protein JXR68_08465 [Bacteroidales bacterium]|nr:hypothetical protein [Bacteroidales bacterium]